MSMQFRVMIAAVLASASMAALGHADPAAHSHGHGLWAGLVHPVTGLDHLAILLLLGAWIHRSGAGWLSVIPLIGGLMAGALLWGLGLPVMVVEGLVLASLPIAAAALVWGGKSPVVIAVLSVLMLFHGLAHAPAAHGVISVGFGAGLVMSSLAVLLAARLAAYLVRVPVRERGELAAEN